MGEAASDNEKRVQLLLTKLRDSPVNNDGASDDVLGTIFDYLLNGISGKSLHWFCSQASSTVVEAATFLLRLFAYNSVKVVKWKEALDRCLYNCSDCVLGLERAKFKSRTTYFGSFSSLVLDNFWSSFGEWELQSIMEKLSFMGLDANSADTTSSIPSTLAYRMVTNLVVFQDARIQSIIHKMPPTEPFVTWPKDPIPPGILALLVDENPAVRRWALAQSTTASRIPIASNDLVPSFRKVAIIVVSSVGNKDGTLGPSSFRLNASSDPAVFWRGLHDLIRFIHPDYLLSNDSDDLRHFTTGHLHDNGPEFEHILRCFILILKRTGSRLWSGEDPEYPQVVFDALKDNSSFIGLLQAESLANPDRPPSAISWSIEFLDTIRDRPVYPEVFAQLAEFMCGELQHDRFGDSRPVFIAYVSKLFLYQYKKQPEVTSDLLDIHADTFTTVLLSRSRASPQWSNARNATRELVHYALNRDPDSISGAIDHLCKWLAHRNLNKQTQGDREAPVLRIRKQIWERMYKTFQPQDLDGLRTIISVVSQASHLDLLLEKGFSPLLPIPEAKQQLSVVNDSLLVIRSGFKDIVNGFVDYNASTSVLNLLKHDGVVKDVIKLMFSPVDDIRNSAQTLVGHAFDVDVRADCYRSLLSNFPTLSLDGLFEFLSTFVTYATTVTEACSLSKWLVRCFTDVLEVLCAKPHGLLHNERFLRGSQDDVPASQLVNLWSSMCKSIQVIYKRTPQWSHHFTTEEMTEWLRDALIFANDLLTHRTTIEVATNTGIASSKQRKATTKKMMQDLHDFFPELTKWLRVTDMELLHQSYTVLQNLLDCFREARMPPPRDALKKLENMIAVARKGDPNRGSRLDNARLSRLEEAISSFEDDEDEIEFVSMTKAKKTAEQPKRSKVRVKDEPPSKSTKPTVQQTLQKTSFPLAKAFSSKPALNEFKASDQEKLNAAYSLPTFKRTKPPIDTVSTTSKSREPSKSAVSSEAAESSGEDDDEEEEESQRTTLAQLAKFQKSPKIRKPAERRQIMQIEIPAEKNPMAERIRTREEARRTTLRLRPDVSGLHRELLAWNYDHTGPYPPGRKPTLASVPNHFSDFMHYRRVYEPLLLLECWSQLLQSKEDKLEFFQCKLDGRQYTGEFSDIDLTIFGGTRKDWFLTESDVVLLRLSNGKTSILGKTLSCRNLPAETRISVRCMVSPSNDPLQIGSTWQIGKVLSLSTLHREYGALVAAEAYDYNNRILHPHLDPIPTIDDRTVKSTMQRYGVNEPQAVAIIASLKTPGFSLIQGPPGTGKTSTICGLVAACLSAGAGPITIHAGKQSTRPNAPKVLICAPSNAAIDEIVGRLKTGIRGLARQDPVLKVVRIGAEQAIGVNVKEVSLDCLVDEKLNTFGAKSTNDIGNEVTALRQELESVKQLRQQKIQEANNVHDNSARTRALEDEIKSLNARRASVSQKLDSLRDKQKGESRAMDAARRKARQEVLQEADVICSTLSGAGHDTLEAFDFEMIVIDEAAQAIELSTLIPLKFKCNRCILVGDPQQLPPTVISQEACKYQYNQSLFVRFQKQYPKAVHLLSIQYRMHPDISCLPSKIFYEGRLQDGPDMGSKTARPWHSNHRFGTYRFFNVKGVEEKSGQSMKNRSECHLAVALFSRLRKEYASFNFSHRIGVVSMYRAQVLEIREAFYQRFGRDIVEEVDFHTVDGFQGQEKDVIILSCVRAGPGVTSVGFLADVRRMNVAITRARSSLFILGNAPTLERSNEVWRNIVQDARSRNTLTDADESFFTKVTLSSDAALTPTRQKSRQIKQTAQSTPTIPTDLVTPQQLKEFRKKGPDNHTMGQPLSEEKDSLKRKRVDSLPSNDPPAPSAAPPELVTQPSQPIPGSSTGPPARPPVQKRPKPAPNIFLPKKNQNKRPA
ncbi:hypothetical protein L218DRAFT_984944 [Marasmius fiardii PR-910]|nr:hypothetical protein L218DRAFT_984944 [Marasmius fiardii PR-910]